MPELPTPSLPEAGESTATPPISTPHHGNKRLAFIAGAAVVGIGTVCGLGYAAWAGYLPHPFMKRPTTEAFINALASMESAETKTNMHIALQDREEDVEPLDFSLFQENDDKSNGATLNPLSFTQMLPSDLDLTLLVISSFTKEDTGANEETHITGTYTGNNISANLDLTTRSVDGVTYLKPDAIPLPIPMFDMNALEGVWVNLDGENEDRTVFSDVEELEEKTDEIEEETNPKEELFTLVEEGIKSGAIIFSVPERVTYKKERAWQIETVIDGEKLRETVISIGNNRETLFPDQTEFEFFTDEFLKTTEKERTKDIYRELFKRMTLSAVVDNESMPLSISFATRIAPKLEDDLLKDRQITLETTMDFSNINQPVTVTAPENTITSKEALALLVGQSMESAELDAQYNTVADIRSALEMYYQENDEYPKNLNDLVGTEDEWRKVTNIPLDALTEKAYIYERTETGYTLKYEMPAPEDDAFSSRDTTIEGTNTATEHFISEEGAKFDDEDEDGISAYDEIMVYGTSDYLEDSDFDGYDDKAEIDGGYNPNGEGTLVLLETTE